ncbi:sugar phosphate isomerase/epimerase [Pseudonocardia nematodicida]|uniref:Sugar phosphate isomerase/epimerase n=1 Tax=Pseudonocardia nematodicida TaxID=1206997 RepID=A0ABV1KI32_9PSEU
MIVTPDEVALGYLTLAVTPEETVRAAAAAGFADCGVRLTPRSAGGPGDLEGLRPAAVADLAAQARATGVGISNVTCFQLNPALTGDAMRAVVDAVHGLGAPVLVVNAFDLEPGRAVEMFARYCELAEPADVRVALEFIPYSSLTCLDDAVAAVRQAGSPSAAITLDLLHLRRCGAGPDDVRRLDPGAVALVQLCDAPADPTAGGLDALREEARTARLPLGAGGLPVREVVAAVPGTCDVEYEVPYAPHARLPPEDRARAARRDIDDHLG